MFAAPAVAKSPWSAKYGPLRELHAADQLGNQEVEIRVALAVRVRRHVHRHAGDRGGEVGAVIEIEAAQEVLVRLALAAVLRDDDAGHGLQHFARRASADAPRAARGDRALAGRLRDADEILGGVLDVGEVRERPRSGHGDVGVEREVQHHVEADRRAGGDVDVAPRRREVDERERHLIAARRQPIEAVTFPAVSDREPRRDARPAQFDGRRPGARRPFRPRTDPDTLALCASAGAATSKSRHTSSTNAKHLTS